MTTKYRLESAVKTETHFAGVGAVINSFDAGIIEPTDEQEAAALNRLVDAGLATVETDGASKKTTTKASEPSAAKTTSEE